MSSMSSFIIQLVLLEGSLFFKYFKGLRIKALSSSGQIPKRVKLFLQHLFLQMVISSFGIHRQLPDPVCSVVCSNQPRKDQWRSCRTLCNLCGSGKTNNKRNGSTFLRPNV